MEPIISLSPTSALMLGEPTPLTQHPAAVYLASLGKGSRRTMKQALNVMALLLTDGTCDALSLDWSKLRYQHTAALRSLLMEKYSPATANKMLCALRRVLKEAQRLGQISADDYARAVDIRTIKGDHTPRGRALSQSEIVALMEVIKADTSLKGKRDAAMLAILMVGLRRSEVVALDLSDFNANTRALQIRQAKGQKNRTVYLPHGAVRAVADWIEVRGTEPGALLIPVTKGGKRRWRRMVDQSVFDVLKARALQAGVEPFSPHDLRRTFVSDLLEAGADIVTVQKLAGHASTETTARYDRRGEKAKLRAVDMINVPY